MSQFNLFQNAEPVYEKIPLNACPFPADLRYFCPLLDGDQANHFFERLMHEVNWQQPSITMGGKRIPIPRLQSWQGNEAHAYRYSGELFVAEPFHPVVAQIKRQIEDRTNVIFNSVLCNLYRDGQDSVSWHADDEPELGEAPVIASYSLGAERCFQFKPKKGSGKRIDLDLAHNSLVLMPAGMQAHYIHQLPKRTRCTEPRINLTFRQVMKPDETNAS